VANALDRRSVAGNTAGAEIPPRVINWADSTRRGALMALKICVAIIGVILAVCLMVLVPPRDSVVTLSAEEIFKRIHSSDGGNWLSMTKNSNDARVRLIYPDLIKAEDAFTVELRADGTDWVDVEFQLSAAGLHIEPDKQWLTPAASKNEGESGVIRWSAKADTTGDFILVVNTRPSERYVRRMDQAFQYTQQFIQQQKVSPPRRVAPKSAGLLDWKMPDLTEAVRLEPVRIHIQGSWQYYSLKALPFVGAILASLMTLPGILAFLEARGEKKRKSLRIFIADEGRPRDLLNPQI
jgi:hypothetical protein